jgi:8-oxo-dGTP diphosphatase
MDWAAVWLLEQRLVSREPGRRRGADRRRPPSRDRLGAVAVADGLAGAFDRARWLLVTESVVRAGGGIVWRYGEGGGVEIVLVHRPVYDDWSFPKGKLHPGETEAQAALREVQEETGLRCRLSREVGTAACRDPKRRPKTVRYWEMTPTAGTLGPANEIDDARWVPLRDVPRLLTYDHDRRLLEGWQPAA